MTFDAKINLRWYLYTIGNDCAKHEHPPLHYDPHSQISSRFDIDLKSQGHISNPKPSLSSAQHKQSLCKILPTFIKSVREVVFRPKLSFLAWPLANRS